MTNTYFSRRYYYIYLFVFLATFPLIACGSHHIPEQTADICGIFRENPEWYKKAYVSYQKWGIPISVTMAIMHQESRFRPKAKPPRTTCLFFFPGPRPSSAYGYAQVLDKTWDNYRLATGNRGADRDDFGDAIDFVGWYCNVTHERCGVAKTDAYNLYLAYHEGQGGFSRKTHVQKKWLLQVARKVADRSKAYGIQLAACEQEFAKPGGCCLWPF